MNEESIDIIIPTYNERENIRPLLERLFRTAETAGLSLEVLFVDDASPDGTGDVVREAGRRYGNRVKLLVRRGHRGLAAAVAEGIAHSRTEILAVMDGDLSHRPEDLPAVLSPVLQGKADFTVGSRYVATSRWEQPTLYRRLNSLLPALLARPLVPLRDPLSGFFAFRRRILCAGMALRPLGYKIGLELLVKTGCRKLREVPIHFESRFSGKSKLSLREQFSFLLHLVHLYGHVLRSMSAIRWMRSGETALERSSSVR